MSLNRRSFVGGSAATLAALSAPMVAKASGKPKVVVIGGGAGGATVARYVAKDSKGAIDVTLIEANKTYYTCFFSNLYIGGFRSYDSIGHSYAKLGSDYGINIVHDWATAVDRDKKVVKVAGGAEIPYDRLVISPGIDFVDGSVPGWDESKAEIMPHAYKAGPQTQLLKSQVENMREGGVFCMIAPPNPYRCPPGPYERICMVAHHLKNHNPKAKILIFDPKKKFSKMALFTEAWEKHYTGMVEWLDASFTGPLEEVRPGAMEVVVGGETHKVDVCNVIPGMKAGNIAAQAGITNDKGWAPVIPATMQSRIDENIHVVGDSSHQGDMPKSGFSANSQAKVCAMAIRGALTGSKVFPARFNNTCWSLVATDDGVKVGASYKATPEKIAKTDGFVSKTGEAADLRKRTYEESVGWYKGITTDMFG